MRSRCSLPKESSRIDETIENRVVRRMAVLVLFQRPLALQTRAPLLVFEWVQKMLAMFVLVS